ncbi:hypothetical protein [Terrabacter aeriphilus]|uniref:hypothetical protein n=1 Tax=Terrabacter aeriphilus TaxID=515662 RepID=UPI0031EEACDA
MIHTTVNGRPLVIAELRGWLTQADERGGADPDWHFHLELDTQWMRTAGINPALFCMPGDVFRDAAPDPTQARRRTGDFGIHIELDGWPRNDERAHPAKPDDWQATDLPSAKPGVTYAYDPRSYAASAYADTAVAVHHYVSIWGALVTDDPHAADRFVYTNELLVNGLQALRVMLDLDPLDRDKHVGWVNYAAKAANAWIWGGDRAYADPLNGARWNEIHSPDSFERLEDKAPDRKCYQVVGCARRGPDDAEKTVYRTVLRGPEGANPGSVLRYRRSTTRWTTPDAAQVSVTVRESGPDAAVTVEVTLLSQGVVPKDAHYCELFELWWETPVKHVGDTWITTRDANGDWVPATDLGAALGVTSVVTNATVAGHPDRGELQVALITNGQVLHAARDTAGTWSPAGDMTGAACLPLGIRAVASAMLADASAQYVALDADGHAWHTVRRPDGSWQDAGDLTAALGVTDPVAWAALTPGTAGDDLDVTLEVFTAVQPVPAEDDVEVARHPIVRPHPSPHVVSKVLHTVRRGDGSWDPVEDLTVTAGLASTVRVAAAHNPNDQSTLLFAVGRDHRVRSVRWQAGQPVARALDLSSHYWTGAPDGAMPAVAATPDGHIQAAVLTTAGQVLHGILRPDGTWTPIGDATGAAHLPAGATCVAATSSAEGSANYVVIA